MIGKKQYLNMLFVDVVIHKSKVSEDDNILAEREFTALSKKMG